MRESFYRMCFQALKSLYELKIINEEEKIVLKNLVLSDQIQETD